MCSDDALVDSERCLHSPYFVAKDAIIQLTPHKEGRKYNVHLAHWLQITPMEIIPKEDPYVASYEPHHRETKTKERDSCSAVVQSYV